MNDRSSIPKPNVYSYNDPIAGAISLGCTGSLFTLIGAAVRSNEIHDECLAVLVGGTILGAGAGCISFFFPRKKEDPELRKLIIAIFDYMLLIVGIVFSPLVGVKILNYDSLPWIRVLIDELLGMSILLAPCICCALCCFSIICLCFPDLEGIDLANPIGQQSSQTSGYKKVPPESAPTEDV
jgi:MFS family permease